MYWLGLRLKPRLMQGSIRTYCVFSSHPLYSITWTWVIFWTKPKYWRFKRYDFKTDKEVISFKNLYCFGFSFIKQDVMLRNEFRR